MKLLKKYLHSSVARLRVFGWACGQTWRAYPLGVSLIASLLLLQGVAPGISLLCVKAIVNLISDAPQVGMVQGTIKLIVIWGSVLLLEGLLEPLVLLVRTRLNLRVLTHCNVMLMEKANSYDTLEPFEGGVFYDEMRLMREEAKYRPLNYCYSVFCAFKEAIAVLSVLAALCSIQPFLSLFVVLCCVPSAVSTIWLGRKGWDFSLFKGPISRKLAWLAGLTMDEKAIKEIRLFGLGDYLTDRYKSTANQLSFGSKREQTLLCFLSSSLSVLTVGGYVCLVIWLLTSPDLPGKGIGAIAITVQALFIAQQQLGQFLQSLGLLAQNLVFFERLHRFVANFSKQRQKATQPSPVSFDTLTFEGVSFRYPNGRKALIDLNLTIKSGETLAIVGANGAGKSTFINLLTRLYEPTKGRILVDGVDMSNIDTSSWRQQVTAVFQDFTLYRFTLGENIQLGDLNKRHLAPQNAGKQGGIDAFVDRLPNKYDTLVGRDFGGATLSGGEEQKLAMSRAFFRDAPLLIFDEPTAALDPHSEQEMFQRVWEEARGRTLVLVTHRLGSVPMADRILVFKEGVVIEEGSHDTLLELGGEYASLYRSQASLYLSDSPLDSRELVQTSGH